MTRVKSFGSLLFIYGFDSLMEPIQRQKKYLHNDTLCCLDSYPYRIGNLLEKRLFIREHVNRESLRSFLVFGIKYIKYFR